MKFIILVSILAVAFADDKVIGGTVKPKGAYPSLVNLRRFNSQFCGGTIITSKFVLSAAHCFVSSAVTAYMGDHSLKSTDNGEQSISVHEMHPHDQYDSSTLENDIMMVELSSSMSFTTTVKAVTLPSRNLIDGELCTVCGWGNTNSAGSDYPDVPYCVGNLEVIPTSECNGRLVYNNQILPGMVCIGSLDGEIDSCQGDSGGPIYKSNGDLAGVVSWGYGCAQKNKPGVYSDARYYSNWILSSLTM